MIDVSYSRVQSYQLCPWLYHLVHNRGWRSRPSAQAALGQSLHRALGLFFSSPRERTLENLQESFDTVWVNEGFFSAEQALEYHQLGQQALTDFFEKDQKNFPNVLFVEKDFSIDFKNFIFRGTVDRIDKSPDGTYEIIEYKSQKDQWPQDKRDTNLQMTLYEWGIRDGLGLSPLRLKYYFLFPGEYFSTQRTPDQIQEAAHLLNDIADRIQKGRFEPNPGHCQRCEFGNRCEYFKC